MKGWFGKPKTVGNGGHIMGDNTHLDIGHHRFMTEHKMVGLQKEEGRVSLTQKCSKCGSTGGCPWDHHNRCWPQIVYICLTNWGIGKRK